MFEFLLYPSVFPYIGFIVGTVFGSFLNVCAYRIPIGKSVVIPSSHCPSCGMDIPWYRNFPVLTWLTQKGKAHCCSFIIPTRYWFVEITVGLVFAYLTFVYTQDLDLVSLISRLLFSWIMIAVMVIDFENMIIPDRLSVGGAMTGILFSFIFPDLQGFSQDLFWKFHFLSGIHSIIGLLVGSALLYWIGTIAQITFGREALGEGDVKLLGCIGAFCGWQGAIFSIFGGAFLGTVLLLPLMMIQKFFQKGNTEFSDNKLEWGAEVPFGPYLAIAGMIYFCGGSIIIDPWFDPILWLFDNTSMSAVF